MRIGEDHLLRERLMLIAMPLPQRIAHLVAVDAALDDVAAVVQLRSVFPTQQRVVLRRRKRGSGAPLGRQLRPVAWIASMQLKGALKGARQPLDRDVVGPERAMRSRAEPAVDGSV